MTTAKAFAQGTYGAFELKRCYQRNMIMGTVISGGLPLLLLAILALVGYLTATEAIQLPGIPATVDTILVVPPPTAFRPKPPETTVNVKSDIPDFGVIPRPVEDNQAMDNAVVMTVREKERIIIADQDGDIARGLATGVYTTGEIIREIIPEHPEFIPVTVEPKLLDAPVPVYPEMARKAGMEGEVWMQVYVDKQGNVRKVIVAKSSNESAGFEQAAEAAAWGRKYTPALQNKQPVGVWVGYRVSFKLRD
jgi:protein TonB